MLADYPIIAFVAAQQPERAKTFYSEVLGLRLASDTSCALVFDACGSMLRVVKVQALVPSPHTVLGWNVPDIRAAMQRLAKNGIAFERYTGIVQDELGVWTTPDDHKVCWFKDPDGNTLSLTQFHSR
jgi:predicted enzyme related to lactoylglutathione lyase